MSEPRSWSVSAHRLYSGCPRAWWLTTVARVPQEDTGDANRGSVLHEGMAAGYAEADRAMREGWPGSTVDRRVESAVDLAVCRAAKYHEYDDIEEAIDICVQALEHLRPRPGDVVLGVESRMETEVEGVPIVYRADVVYQRDGVLTLRDWKSRSDLPRERDLGRDRQLALGALLAARTFPTQFLATRTVRVEIASIASGVAVGAIMDKATALDAGTVVAATARRAEQETRFEPTPGAVCASCKVRSHCPVFANEETPEVGPDAAGNPVVRVRTPQMVQPSVTMVEEREI